MGKRNLSFPAKAWHPDDYKRSFFQKLSTAWETRHVGARMRKATAEMRTDVTLANPTGFRALQRNDLPLVFLTHNDMKFMRSFLSHYRALGVTRFICVDDQSTDGTREFLSAEPDVDVWISAVRYKDARRGRMWRESLFGIYGRKRWYVNVDSDEYLVYQNYADMPLPKLIRHLEKLGVRRLSAPMLDMYPPGPPGEFPFTGTDDTMPWTVASCFDGDGYTLEITKRFLHLRGGPRQRRFQSVADLMKYPLLYWDHKCSLGTTIHKPLPYGRNFFPISAALLHFKFFSDYKEKTVEAVEDRQYFDSAGEYEKILKSVSEDGEVNFVYDHMLHYSHPDHLLREGFIRPLWT